MIPDGGSGANPINDFFLGISAQLLEIVDYGIGYAQDRYCNLIEYMVIFYLSEGVLFCR